MPPLTAELANALGLLIVALLVVAVTLAVDPVIRRRRAANRLTRMRRHAAQGCEPCLIDLEIVTTVAEAKALEDRLAAVTYSARPAGGKGGRR